MTERYYLTPGGGMKIKWGGPTDLKELYRQMKIWLEDQGYTTEPTLEKKYVENIKPSGKEIYVLWEAGKKVSDYFTYKMVIEFILVALNDVEVQQGNAKVKLTKGTLEIRITAFIEYGEKWESISGLGKLYYKIVGKQRLEDYVEKFYDKVYKFQRFIKDFIGLVD